MRWLHWVFWWLVLVAVGVLAAWLRSDRAARNVDNTSDDETGR
jgi:hypothetical protein